MSDTKQYSGRRSILRSAGSAVLGFALCNLLLFAGAMLLQKGILSEKAIPIFCFGVIAISGFFSAFLAAGKGERRIASSLAAGMFFYLLALLLGKLLGGVIDAGAALIMAIILLIDCVVGAVVSGLVRG